MNDAFYPVNVFGNLQRNKQLNLKKYKLFNIKLVCIKHFNIVELTVIKMKPHFITKVFLTVEPVLHPPPLDFLP
jgi:hypothetical protein